MLTSSVFAIGWCAGGPPKSAHLTFLARWPARDVEPWGWGVKQLLSPNQMGLINLDGTVISSRPFRDWRGKGERRR